MPFAALRQPRADVHRRPLTVAARAAAALAAVALVGACGSATPAQSGGTVTVTVTPTVIATGGQQPTTGSSAATGAVNSDVVGRRFDLGSIVKTEQQNGVDVIVFDRWTAKGVKDGDLAARGVPIVSHAGSLFENQNSRLTYRIPVAAGATFTYRHCVAVDQPVQSRSATLPEFAGLAAKEKVILLTLDADGRVTHADNDPAC